MKTKYYPLHCKNPECNSLIGYYPYRDKNEAVALFYGKFLCKVCKVAGKK